MLCTVDSATGAFRKDKVTAGVSYFSNFDKVERLSLPTINSDLLLALIVPLLALPQSTHYVLDGFIWKIKKQDAGQRAIL